MTKMIDRNAAAALLAGMTFREKATEVRIPRKGRADLVLHGNLIAVAGPERLSLSLCGWNTVTTRARLNAVLGAVGSPYRFAQRKHRAALIDGDGNTIGIDTDAVIHFIRETGALEHIDGNNVAVLDG